MADVGAYVKAAMLLERLVIELAQTRAGEPAVSTIHPGNMVVDYGCAEDGDLQGSAMVRVAGIAPMSSFPTPVTRAMTDGDMVEYSVQLEMVVTRCYFTPEDNGMPRIAALDSAARDAMDDAAAMRRAAQCTFDTFIPGAWAPRGPSGGIHGGSMVVTVQADLHCGCDDDEPPPLDTLVLPLDGDPRF